MNAGATAERAYDALKQRVMCAGLRPGERLDPTVLAGEFSTSATPVRDALHRMTGERLVERRVSDGFHTPVASDPALQDLYAWNAEVLLLALKPVSRTPSPEMLSGSSMGGTTAIVERTVALFARIASWSGNDEHLMAVRSINDRLYPARLVEPQAIVGLAEELDDLTTHVERQDMAVLRKALTAYHRRRRRAASELVRLLYRHG